MFLKKINQKGITSRLIFWSSFTYIVSVLAISLIIYTLLVVSIKNQDRLVIQRISESIEHASDPLFLAETLRSEDMLIAIVGENQKIFYKKLPFSIDNDSEDEEEITQLDEYIKRGELRLGWDQVLFRSHKDTHFLGRLEYDLRSFLREKKYVHLLPLIDNDMFEVQTKKLKDGRYLLIGRSFEATDEYIEKVREIMLLVVLPFLLINLIVNYFLSRTILKPVKKLAITIDDILAGNVDSRVELPKNEDEIKKLSISFNRLLDEKEATLSNLKETIDNVAHDIRTPLTSFRSSVELSLLGEGDVFTMRDSLIEGLESSDKILKLINAILDSSEQRGNLMRLNYEKINLSDLLKQLVDVYEYAFEEKEMSLKLNVENDLFIKIDQVRILQAFGNLLDNALKYSANKTQVEISVSKENIRENDIIIEFKDQGMGIGQENIEKIWQRLYRADSSRTSEGLGIGLSVVKTIIHAHQGKAEVKSTLGVGSSFIVRLPVCND